MIKLATIEDLDEILQIVKSAIVKMRSENIDQWDEIYPDTTIIENDIQCKSLYKYFIGNTIAAFVTINTDSSPEYEQISWKDNSGNYSVIHRLTVHPVFQGKGIATELICFCEYFSISNKKSSIRLDAFMKNPIAVNLYRRLGYQERGIVQFRKGDFFCFEKFVN